MSQTFPLKTSLPEPRKTNRTANCSSKVRPIYLTLVCDAKDRLLNTNKKIIPLKT